MTSPMTRDRRPFTSASSDAKNFVSVEYLA